MPKFIVVECCYGVYQGTSTINASDTHDAYAKIESEGHNASSFFVFPVKEAKKLFADLKNELKK